MKHYLAVAVLSLFVGCTSSGSSELSASQIAPDSSGSTAAETSGSISSSDVVRCRSIRETGSRVRTRVCRTEREWKRIRTESQESIRRSEAGGNQVQSSDS